MFENGFIKLHRSIVSWEWYDDANTMRVFIHLLLTVSIRDSEWHGLTVKRGSRVSSIGVLAEELHLSVQSVRTAIKHLELTGELTRLGYSKFTVFKVNNYEKYQQVTSQSTENQQSANNHPTKNQQQYKKIKEDKKKIEEDNNSSPDSGLGKPAVGGERLTIGQGGNF